MDLKDTLIVGSYIWTTGVAYALWKLIEHKVDLLMTNHLAHLEAEIKRLGRQPRRRSRVRRPR